MIMFGAAALVAFGFLAHSVSHGRALSGVDRHVFTSCRGTVTGTAAGERFWVLASLAGSPASMTLLAVLGALWLGWRRRTPMLVWWITAFAGTSLLIFVLKRAFHRVRPDGAELFLHGASLSFPSGHAAGAMVGFGMLTYMLSRYVVNSAIHRASLVVIAAGIVGLIAYSRLCLGVHYPSDVIAGLLLGTAWLIIGVTANEFTYRQRVRDRA
ncbi:phosphatase PAP2 family protein [Gemmatimonas sp.]|uniref:phosphatase PAP2 family protein n=1 Tax=Gemmatimonas sp. TaxID=1962908 RepID=UPI003983C198